MQRAIAGLVQAGDPGDDLRVPVAAALFDILGDGRTDDELASLVDAMTPIAAGGLTRAAERRGSG